MHACDFSVTRAKSSRHNLSLACFTLALCALSAPASAVTYTIIDVPGEPTWATSINNSGTIAGMYGQSGHEHGYVRSADGTFTLFDPQGSIWTVSTGINDAGLVVGSYEDPNGETFHGFIRKPGGKIDIISAGISTDANAIDANGDICGSFYSAWTDLHGFVRTADGTLAQIDGPNSSFTQAFGINDSGTVTGWFYDGTTSHGFVRTPDGNVTPIDVPGSEWTEASTINADGSIAGAYANTSGVHFFVRDPGGEFTSFDAEKKTKSSADYPAINTSGLIAGAYRHHHSLFGFIRKPDGKIKYVYVPGARGYTFPGAVNDNGVIVGTIQDVGNNYHGFLRTP